MRNRKNSKYFFNMVEIVLAIGILAVGFSAILGLFPVAIKIVKASQTESVVSDAVEDLNAYFRTMARVPLIDSNPPHGQLEGEFWYALLFYEDTDFEPPSVIPSQYVDYRTAFHKETDLEGLRNDLNTTRSGEGAEFLEDLRDFVATRDADVVRDDLRGGGFNLLPHLNLFQRDKMKTEYYLVKGDERFSKIDLSAQIIVWKSKMQKIYAKATDPYDGAGLDYRYGAVLNMEISWPLTAPYGEREKRYYQFTIANPKE